MGIVIAYELAVMSTRRKLSGRKARSAAAGSWIALLAATTLGDAADALRAEVKADGLSDGATYRLVVQSYDSEPGAVNRGTLPGRRARPVGSVQRAVTADELRLGVHVSLVEIRPTLDHVESPFVVAWIEAGQPDLEFDGRKARPRPGSVYGLAKRTPSRNTVQISLNRTMAA